MTTTHYQVEVTEHGHETWYLNHKRHRENGPAVIWGNGQQEYYLNDLLHREDGPAIIKPNEYGIWFLHGKCHREDGPAVCGPKTTNEWWLHGKLYTEEEFKKKTQPKEHTITELEQLLGYKIKIINTKDCT